MVKTFHINCAWNVSLCICFYSLIPAFFFFYGSLYDFENSYVFGLLSLLHRHFMGVEKFLTFRQYIGSKKPI